MIKDSRSGAFRSWGRRGPIAFAAVAVMLGLAGCQTTGRSASVTEQAARPAMDAAQVERALDLAQRALAEDRPNDARQIVQQVGLAGHEGPRAQMLAGEAALALGELDQAVAALRPLVEAGAEPAAAGEAATAETRIDRPRVKRSLGLALLRQGKLVESGAMLAEAAADNPKDWRVWNGLAFIADTNRAFDEAEDHYARALEHAGDLAKIHNNRGFSRLMQGRPDDAITDLTAALRHDPGMTVAETNMRLALAWRGDYSRAVSGVATGDRGDALNNAGFVALMRGDYPNAERYLRQALDQDAGFNKQAYRNLTYLRSITDPGADAPADPGAIQTGAVPSRE